MLLILDNAFLLILPKSKDITTAIDRAIDLE